MLKRGDLVDLIMRHLSASGKASADAGRAGGPAPSPAGKGRLFLSEYEIKRLLTPGSTELKIPRGAILSPLAVDWIILKGIKVVREQ